MLQYFGQFLIAHRKIRVSGRLDNQAANRKSRGSDYDMKIVRPIDVIDRVGRQFTVDGNFRERLAVNFEQ